MGHDGRRLLGTWTNSKTERKAAAAALKAVEARIDTIKDSLTIVAEQEEVAKFVGERGEVAVAVKH